MDAIFSALGTAGMICGAVPVLAYSVFEYLWRGPRLPAWDFAFQVQRDLVNYILTGVMPQLDDGPDIDGATINAYVARLRAMMPKGAPIAATEGISKDIAINVQQVPIDPAAFEGIGVAEDGLRALCVSDQQGPGRELIAELLVALPAATTLRPRAADGEALLECRPIHAREPILLYLHGGGYVVGNRHICRPLTRWISEDASVRVLSAEYRLAPEHPFPAAVHDALIVYKFLLQQGFDADRIIVGGDSAGGHLVLALTHLVRFMRIAQPAALVLISPVANMSRNAPSLARNRNYDSLAMSPVESPISFARMYHRPGRQLTEQLRAELADMLLSPVNGDFAGFPPTLIQGGSIELFIDDITELHAAISAQNPGSPDLAVLEAFTDMPHVFHGLAHRPEAKRATASIVHFIRRVAEMDS